MKPHQNATCMHRNKRFFQSKRSLLTKIWTIPFQHPVPFIASPKTISHDVISNNNTVTDTLISYSSPFLSCKETPGLPTHHNYVVLSIHHWKNRH